MADNIQVIDHSAEVLADFQRALAAGLAAIGLSVEGHAKQLLTEQGVVDTGRLRNSITHVVDEDEKAVYVGTNVEYAPYIELGTGVYAEDGAGRRTPWWYEDDKGEWHVTSGMPPRPYLRPAVQDYRDEYQSLLEDALKRAKG